MADRSVKQIREDVAASRAKLTAATQDAFESVKPANLARDAAEQVKAFATTEFNTAFGHFRNADGSLRMDRVLMVGGAVVGALVLAVSVKRIGARRSLARTVRLELER